MNISETLSDIFINYKQLKNIIMQNIKEEFGKYVKNHLGYKGLKGDQIIQSTENQLITNSITPNIVEEREMRVSIIDIFSRLMKDRIIWLNGVVDDRMSTVTQAQLMFLSNLDNERSITMHVDTPGGSVKSGLSIIDVMNYIPNDISTINTGMAASMGSVLLSHGTEGMRHSLVNSKMMVHQASSGTQGHVNDQLITLNETLKYNYVLIKMLSQRSKLSLDEILRDHERDVWYNSDEQLKYGFIDEVVDIDNQVSITKQLEGFEDYRERLFNKHSK
jgi:ATP-dependent Clp protease protease subunit